MYELYLTNVFFQCAKNENFRRHMLLLWQNNVSMSIEVREEPDISDLMPNLKFTYHPFVLVAEVGAVMCLL